jgi:hypothetical protein
MPNPCVFSPCRKYRYRLEHDWRDMLSAGKSIMWIGLNPSTADENDLDPTLRRIRGFSTDWGFDSFIMTNLFAYRATKRADMLRYSHPIGPDNDRILQECAESSQIIITAWGNDGSHMGRDRHVLSLLPRKKVFCLGRNGDGTPCHPLYLAGSTKRERFSIK